MTVTIRADDFAENLEPEELGEILAVLAGDFGENGKAFAAFIQHACDEARNHHRMPDGPCVADDILNAFESAAAAQM